MSKLKNYTISFPLACLLLVLLTVSSCKQDELQTIVVKTVAPTSSASVSPFISCEIVSSAGLPITKRGVCFSSFTNPTLLDGYVLSTSNTNEFSVQIPNLISNKQYYIRTFAMSGAMIFYGNTITYRTGSVWKQLSNVGGIGRFHAVGFALNGLGYIGTGYTGALPLKDFWEYNPYSDVWSQRADFGGTARLGSFCLAIGTKAYVGTGYAGEGADAIDFWEYNPALNEWTKKADDIGTIGRFGASTFVINGKGYVGTGDWGGVTNNFWEYSPTTISWAGITPFAGTARKEAVGFSINGKGYVGTGVDNGDYYKKDFWEYDPANNSWTRKADFPGLARSSAVGFAIGNKGYIGAGATKNGTNWTFYSDFWEYDPSTNSWRQIEDFAGGVRFRPVAFVIGNKAYVGTGISSTSTCNDLWEFSPR
jgi:N-acetylneuraminic acid mutarotase